jgi:hypothetical protein
VELEQDIARCGACKRDLPEDRVTGTRDGQPLCNDCKYDGGPPAEPTESDRQCHTCKRRLPAEHVHWNGNYYRCEQCSGLEAWNPGPGEDPWHPTATVPAWPTADEPPL